MAMETHSHSDEHFVSHQREMVKCNVKAHVSVHCRQRPKLIDLCHTFCTFHKFRNTTNRALALAQCHVTWPRDIRKFQHAGNQAQLYDSLQLSLTTKP